MTTNKIETQSIPTMEKSQTGLKLIKSAEKDV
jgi:hypothetical protein